MCRVYLLKKHLYSGGTALPFLRCFIIKIMPLMWLSIAFLTGLGLGITIVLPPWFSLTLLVVTVLLAFVEIRTKPNWSAYGRLTRAAGVRLAVLLLAAALGFAWMTWHNQPATPVDLAYYNDGQRWVVEGVVANMPERAARGQQVRLAVKSLSNGNAATPVTVSGIAQATMPNELPLHYGDQLRLSGRLLSPAHAASGGYATYLRAKGVQTLILKPELTQRATGRGNPLVHAIYAVRERAYQKLHQYYPAREASLLSGILLGLDAGIPKEMEEDFRDSGLSHIIAISGFNISLLAGVLSATFRRLLGHWQALLATLTGLAFYTVLAGAEPSVVRAAIMGSIAVFGAAIGRQQSGLTSLTFTAAVLALFQPLILLDVGFQLSFAATLGLVLFAGPWQQALEAKLLQFWPAQRSRTAAAWIGEYLLVTLAAQLLTLPIVAYQFHRVSIISLIANPLALPVQPLLMIMGGLSALAGMVLTWAGQALAWLTLPLAAYTIKIASFFGSFGVASIDVKPFPPAYLLLYYAVVALIVSNWSKISSWRQYLKPGLALGLTALAVSALWMQVLDGADGYLHLKVLPAQAGEALILKTGKGTQVLVLRGVPEQEELDRIRRNLSDSAPLQAVVWAGGQAASAELPAVFDAFTPAQKFCISSATAGGRTNSMDCTPVTTGDILLLGEDIKLRTVYASKLGSALLIETGRRQVFFPGPFFAQTIMTAGIFPSQPVDMIVHTADSYDRMSAFEAGFMPQRQVVLAAEVSTANALSLPAGFELVSGENQMWVRAID